ncbi:bifunctional diguanylate cyclase/phosphodiesterase [Microvirga subterranea]|uniref:PAS domain S-box-containing protein/diguanylate cyclase (GGDEF)-like protein n=1 Tax=Microvirga subterranea TaxID=186651 RepID=A0A370HLF9_9HYPH|nr:EAL domain-containing protein [Microvirga subterranea]RDI59180.1 PAS domain S-box-containing protein/diguanylate cyclase (GGDEF)-like protein [Microvirga subterranea]
MLTVYDCLVTRHDLRLVALAAVVCALASFTVLNLLNHVRRSEGPSRQVWIYVAAVAGGFGTWATHFIGMLAFSPDLNTGYDIGLTALSLLAAICIMGLGMTVALLGASRWSAWLGGAVMGGGIASMHYLGMAAFQVPGRLSWDGSLVATSIAAGIVLGAAAMRVGLRDGRMRSALAGAVLLTLAIAGHHFTAMGAVTIAPDPTRQVSAVALSSEWLAVAVALASFAILVLSFAGLALDLRDRRRARLEIERMRSLANAAVEGLLVCDGETVVSANSSFTGLTGFSPGDIVGADLSTLLPLPDVIARLLACPDQAVEADLRQSGGGVIPVELIMRTVTYADKPHNVIAVRDLRDRKQAEARIHFLAHHDALTGLANRTSFDHRLDLDIETHRKTQERFAVLCLDLDRFKEINDIFGHSAGDHLLCKAAEKLKAALDDDQMLARVGGDEFAVIMPGLRDPVQAGRLAERLLQALEGKQDGGPFDLISVSIGIAIYPDDASGRTALLSNADAALYRAKKEGRGTYRFFEVAMSEEVRERRMIEHDLRLAIEKGEMAIAYQPQTRIGTQEITGFEALLRWNHPVRGDMSPAVFIPIAEESGIILRIGEWVLREACREASSWDRPLKIAVNVSALQVNNPTFVTLVQAILDESGLAPERLELEITESVLIRDPERALQTLTQLKAIGVSIAMDDFGTGYSSLSNLRNFPFDKIKIDRSFVRAIDVNIQAAAIVRAVLGLGRGLGLPVIAEGVETNGELAFLNAEGCREAQGYLFGQPAPIEMFRSVTHAEAVA